MLWLRRGRGGGASVTNMSGGGREKGSALGQERGLSCPDRSRLFQPVIGLCVSFAEGPPPYPPSVPISNVFAIGTGSIQPLRSERLPLLQALHASLLHLCARPVPFLAVPVRLYQIPRLRDPLPALIQLRLVRFQKPSQVLQRPPGSTPAVRHHHPRFLEDLLELLDVVRVRRAVGFHSGQLGFVFGHLGFVVRRLLQQALARPDLDGQLPFRVRLLLRSRHR
mmetsp:Transcript_37548/g.76598  ORF Transcript_37548/g.76598 Transcript_37548/m.76598 type:complete len:223 (-) Transcript_37548:62-730(-)